MKRRVCKSILSTIAILFSTTAYSALAQVPVRLTGQIHDASPSSVKGGPWEFHGQWSLELRPGANTADFSADITMADFVITAGVIDPTQPGQNPHTHDIRMTNQKITWNMIGCPSYSPATPATKMGFQINGTVSLLTANGSNSPFETTPPSSTLQVCITGGNTVPFSVPYSNVTLVFGAPATSHFGTQAIHGVVRTIEWGD